MAAAAGQAILFPNMPTDFLALRSPLDKLIEQGDY